MHEYGYAPLTNSQHTLGHIACEACREIALAKMEPQELARLPLQAAAEVWLESRRGIDEQTRKSYRAYTRSLLKFFDRLTLAEITVGHIATYQTQRASGEISGRPVGVSAINHELNTLQQIMQRAGEWARIADWYEPLAQQKPKVGCALSEEQEARLLRIASSRKRWFVAYCCALLTVNTTAGPGEIRRLQLCDVDLGARTIYIREGAKNDARVRRIPLNEDALWAARELMTRAAAFGAVFPSHYLLPHRASKLGEKADPSRPMGGWRSAWEALREAAGMPQLRYYDLRHHSITKLLENPNVPERTVTDLAGHVSNHMLDTYSHVRRAALESAVEAVGTSVTKRKGPVMIYPKAKEPACTQNSPEKSQPPPSPTSPGSSQSIYFSSATYQRK